MFGQSLGLTEEWFAIEDARLHHRVSHRIFLKDEALLRKFYILRKYPCSGIFFAILLKSPDSYEMASMCAFEVVKFTSVVKIDLSFFGDRGIIFAPRLGLS